MESGSTGILAALILAAGWVPAPPARAIENVQGDADSRTGIRYGAMPIWNYSSSRGLTVGAIAQRFDYGGEGKAPYDSLWTAQVSYATQAETGVLLDYQKIGVGRPDVRIEAELYAFHNPAQRYYGLGDQTTFDPALEAQGFYFYTQDHVELDLTARRTLAPGLDLLAGLLADSDRIAANAGDSQFLRDFGAPAAPTAAQLELETGAILDRRDSELIPSRGYYLADTVVLAPSWLSLSGAGWLREDADSRVYLPFTEDRWLGAAFQARYTYTSDGTPIFEKARLGSLGTVRGYRLNRYLSNHSASVRGELRSLWFRERIFGLPAKLGTAVFADTGMIGDTLGRLFSNPVHPSWGVTVFGSYFTDDFLGHTDLAFSPEGAQIYVALGYAF